MILIAGTRQDDCLNLVEAALRARGVECAWFDQGVVRTDDLVWTWKDGRIAGQLHTPNVVIDLESVRGVYLRLEHASSKAERLHPNYHLTATGSFSRWTDLTPSRVLSRSGAGSSNFSKPYQLQLLRRAGLNVPNTLVTSDPDAAKAFIEHHQDVIIKGISATRTIVRRVSEVENSDLQRVRHCPVQLQQTIMGTNIRVHVVGSRALAVEVHSDDIDYRYARSHEFRVHSLPAAVEAQCLNISRQCGLELAGIDLIQEPGGKYVALEVNSMPAFSWFQDNLTEHDVSGAIADLLAQGPSHLTRTT
jgi:hypothetical protein